MTYFKCCKQLLFNLVAVTQLAYIAQLRFIPANLGSTTLYIWSLDYPSINLREVGHIDLIRFHLAYTIYFTQNVGEIDLFQHCIETLPF